MVLTIYINKMKLCFFLPPEIILIIFRLVGKKTRIKMMSHRQRKKFTSELLKYEGIFHSKGNIFIKNRKYTPDEWWYQVKSIAQGWFCYLENFDTGEIIKESRFCYKNFFPYSYSYYNGIDIYRSMNDHFIFPKEETRETKFIRVLYGCILTKSKFFALKNYIERRKLIFSKEISFDKVGISCGNSINNDNEFFYIAIAISPKIPTFQYNSFGFKWTTIEQEIDKKELLPIYYENGILNWNKLIYDVDDIPQFASFNSRRKRKIVIDNLSTCNIDDFSKDIYNKETECVSHFLTKPFIFQEIFQEKNSRETFQTNIVQPPRKLLHAPYHLCDNFNFVLNYLQDEDDLKEISDRLKDNEEFIKSAILINPSILKYASPRIISIICQQNVLK